MVVILNFFFYKLTMAESYKLYMECETVMTVMTGRIWNVNALCWAFIFFQTSFS